jgi:hypothetical protein
LILIVILINNEKEVFYHCTTSLISEKIQRTFAQL